MKNWLAINSRNICERIPFIENMENHILGGHAVKYQHPPNAHSKENSKNGHVQCNITCWCNMEVTNHNYKNKCIYGLFRTIECKEETSLTPYPIGYMLWYTYLHNLYTIKNHPNVGEHARSRPVPWMVWLQHHPRPHLPHAHAGPLYYRSATETLPKPLAWTGWFHG